MHRFRAAIIMTIIAVAAQLLVTWGAFTNIDHRLGLGDWHTGQLLLRPWSPYGCLLLAALFGVWCWRRQQPLVLWGSWMLLLLSVTVWEVLAKQLFGQPAGLLGCMIDGCMGTSPSGHMLRATLWCLLLAYVVWPRTAGRIIGGVYVAATAAILIGNQWHWTSDVLCGLLVAIAGWCWWQALLQRPKAKAPSSFIW